MQPAQSAERRYMGRVAPVRPGEAPVSCDPGATWHEIYAVVENETYFWNDVHVKRGATVVLIYLSVLIRNALCLYYFYVMSQ